MSSVCIVVPVYREEPVDWEILSIEQLTLKLGEREIYFAAPKGFDASRYLEIAGHREVCFFDRRFFASRDAYNALLVEPDFYGRFASYEFMLMHQTDAFVIDDQLDYWVERGYDFIGAPFWSEWGAAKPLGMTGVGNGGFSLRRMEPVLQTLRRADRPYAKLLAHVPRTRARALARTRGDSLTEDRYWTEFRVLKNVAPLQEAARFAFEMGLEYFGDYYEDVTPFGCHAPWNLDYVLRHRRGDWRRDEPDYERVIYRLMRRTGNLGPFSPGEPIDDPPL